MFKPHLGSFCQLKTNNTVHLKICLKLDCWSLRNYSQESSLQPAVHMIIVTSHKGPILLCISDILAHFTNITPQTFPQRLAAAPKLLKLTCSYGRTISSSVMPLCCTQLNCGSLFGKIVVKSSTFPKDLSNFDITIIT